MSDYCANFQECRNSLKNYYGHNGQPLFDGRVCDDCNKLVVLERYYIHRMKRT